MSKKRRRSIFVTVGTTLFEALVEGTTSAKALQWMSTNGYTHLVVQYGKGKAPGLPTNRNSIPISIECYDFKPSLEADMRDADLVISHAGAGTVMECLRLGKRLVVVINTILMGNHQTELAEAMGDRNHLFVVKSPELLRDGATWDAMETFEPVPKKSGDEHDFSRLMNSFFGFDKVS